MGSKEQTSEESGLNLNSSKPLMGMNTDVSPENIRENTQYIYALNATFDSLAGDTQVLSNEHSNVLKTTLANGSTLLHSIYIGDKEHCLFIYNKVGNYSEIGIFNEEREVYTVFISDENSSTKLGITLLSNIRAVYRIRRGCQKTVYFVDGINRPRVIDLSSSLKYYDGNNLLLNAFNIEKIVETYPTFDSFDVEEDGRLQAGSYNFCLQLLDEDLNPTEWLVASDTINIYHSSGKTNFEEIRGSTSKKTFYQNFEETTKSIIVDVGNLDKSFKYYRLAVVYATSGTGEISGVGFLPRKPLSQTTTVFTSTDNFEKKGSLEELKALKTSITSAKDILQIENRLILANTSGVQLNLCELQKFASRIQSNYETKTVYLNDISEEGNPKRATANLEAVGYMPGEIYSFGIVYIFKSGFISPVYHIPGRNSLDTNSNMGVDNMVEGLTYVNRSCPSNDYWGLDAKGESLVNKKVRHHRFPTREEIGIPLFNTLGAGSTQISNVIRLRVTGTIDTNAPSVISLQVNYTENGGSETINFEFNKSDYNSLLGMQVNIVSSLDALAFTSYLETSAPTSGLFFIFSVEQDFSTLTKTIYTTQIIGVSFSNIVLPDIGGDDPVVSYSIVRQKRTEENKTVFDTALLLPVIKESRPGVNIFSGIGFLFPRAKANKLQTDVMGIYNPEYKFNKKTQSTFSSIKLLGYYEKTGSFTGQAYVEDTQPGTSYDSSRHKKRERDEDGFSLRVIHRLTQFLYSMVTPVTISGSSIKKVGYLNSFDSTPIQELSTTPRQLHNISADNRFGYIHFNSAAPFDLFNGDLYVKRLPYVQLLREISNPYSKFETTPYYKEFSTPKKFIDENAESCTIFNGDTYLTSVQINSTTFRETVIKQRAFKKTGFFTALLGGLIALVGAILIPGAGLLIATSIISAGLSLAASGIKKEKMISALADLYEKGLKDTVNDEFTSQVFPKATGTGILSSIINSAFGYSIPPVEDDEIQWFMDSIGPIWFESQVNQGLRIGTDKGFPDFLPSPYTYTLEAMNNYCLNKLTTLDASRNSGRVYTGLAAAELYEVNPDYARREDIKSYFSLPDTYECCSECSEQFTHRLHWSEQSFQEELVDNYSIFLPNNYKDLEGDSGEIKSLFKIGDTAFVHTKEALWQIPPSIQERVTNNIVSYLGTGEFLSIPARKVVDSENGLSNGLGKNGNYIKTPYGVVFISDIQKGIYLFQGQQVTPLHFKGMFNFFKLELDFYALKQLNKYGIQDYQYIGNTSPEFGLGFTLGYDSRKERLILTKRDFSFLNLDIVNNIGDFWIENYNDQWFLYQDVDAIVQNYNDSHIGQTWVLDSIKEGKINLRYDTVASDYRGIDAPKTFYASIPGEQINLITKDQSFTLTYSFRNQCWESFMSYVPTKYVSSADSLYSYDIATNGLWKHNTLGQHLSFYGVRKDFIIDYASSSSPVFDRVWDYISIYTKAKKYDSIEGGWVEVSDITFNKAIFYNSTQTSGELTLKQKGSSGTNWYNSICASNEVIIEGNSGTFFTINNIRDNRIDYNKPVWITNKEKLVGEVSIDKVLNTDTIDFNKPWSDKVPLKGKYLGIRLIFNTFEDVTLLFNYSAEAEKMDL